MKMTKCEKLWLTKYVVGAKANPPKNPSRPPKKGKVMPMNIVSPVVNHRIKRLEVEQTRIWPIRICDLLI